MKNLKFYIGTLFIVCMGLNACKKEREKLPLAVTLDRKDWAISADSETPEGWENTGFATALIDGDKNTYWHTNYETIVPYPHWVLIDMKNELSPVSVGITNRQGGTTPNKAGMKLFKMEGSVDGANWINLGDYTFGITDDEQSFPVSSAKAIRYLKITALTAQGTANHTFLSEINVVGLEN